MRINVGAGAACDLLILTVSRIAISKTSATTMAPHAITNNNA